MSNNQLICIRRPEPGLGTVFEEMYLNERLVDVTLSCCDGQLQAHRLVLAACSPYFSNLFSKLANPFYYPVIVIKDMNIEDLRLITDFMYKGQLIISQEKLTSLTKSAENLQITGLSKADGSTISNVDNGMTNGPKMNLLQKCKKTKKSLSNNHHQFNRTTYQQQSREGDSSPSAAKMLEQSMITVESMDAGHHHQFSHNGNDPTSTKYLSNHQIHTSNSTSAIQVGHHHSDPNHPHASTNQFMGQVLSSQHTFGPSRSTNRASSTDQQGAHQIRGRLHPCNICWKTFREKANLKRHLQVHSLDRIVYACPDCNKTFAWKDNYIRHTKTSHHMNNVRPQT